LATHTVTEIIDELIPQSERGILLNHSIENMGAGEYQVAEYQNVTISRYLSPQPTSPSRWEVSDIGPQRFDMQAEQCSSMVCTRHALGTVILVLNDSQFVLA
jgi:hypothetical protein